MTIKQKLDERQAMTRAWAQGKRVYWNRVPKEDQKPITLRWNGRQYKLVVKLYRRPVHDFVQRNLQS